jgi:hypothetical protein
MAARSVRPINLLVVGDGFPKGTEQTFKDSLDAIKRGFALLPGAGGSGPAVQIEKQLLTVKKAGDSKLGLTYVDDETQCYFQRDMAAVLSALVKLTPKKFVPDRYVVVLAGNDNGACSDGTVMFVRANVLAVAVAHEMGHSFAGLMDERGRGDTTFNGCIKWRNCSSDAVHTPWAQTGDVSAFLRCNAFASGIFHPAERCTMNNPNHPFCAVCKQFVQTALSTGVLGGVLPDGGGCDREPSAPVPWQKAMNAREGVEIVAIIDAERTITVMEKRDAPEESLRPQFITGDTFVVAYDDTRDGAREIVAVAPLPMDAGSARLMARSYAPSYLKAELLVPQTARLIRFTLLGVNLTTLRTKDLRLIVKSLPTAREFLFVDEQTVRQLQPATEEPGGYDLQAAL